MKPAGLGWEARKAGGFSRQPSLSWQQWKNPRSFLTFVLGTEEKCLQLAAVHWRTMTTLQVWVVHCREFLSFSHALSLRFCKKKRRGGAGGRDYLWKKPGYPLNGAIRPLSQLESAGWQISLPTAGEWIAQVGNILIKVVHFLPFWLKWPVFTVNKYLLVPW